MSRSLARDGQEARPPTRRGRPAGPLARERPGLVWTIPAGCLFVAFGLLPIAGVIYLSFTSWNGLGNPQWVGADNWKALTDDPDIVKSIRLTAVLTVVCWATQTPLALLLGVWASGRQRNRKVLAVVFGAPLLLSTVAIALTWQALLDPNFGLAATIGKYVGVPDGNFLGHPTRALGAVAVVVGWQFIPFHTLIYQGAASQVPAVLYEAASLDGAGRVRQFFAVTLPQLRNTIVASSVLVVVGTMTYFESILLLTGGGPGTDTRTLPLHMYVKGFIAFDMGYASAVAVLLVLLGATLSILIVRITGYQRMTSQSEGL